MATTATAARAGIKPNVGKSRAQLSQMQTFTWVGIDKRGIKIKGEHGQQEREPGQGLAAPAGHQPAGRQGEGEAAVRQGRQDDQGARRRGIQPPARDDDGRGRADGAGLRDRRGRSDQSAHEGHADRHQDQHRRRLVAARVAGKASRAVRRAVRQPGQGRRIGRRARHRARHDRDVQGKHRNDQGQDQEGDVLSRGRHRGRAHRLFDPADLRHSASSRRSSRTSAPTCPRSRRCS